MFGMNIYIHVCIHVTHTQMFRFVRDACVCYSCVHIHIYAYIQMHANVYVSLNMFECLFLAHTRTLSLTPWHTPSLSRSLSLSFLVLCVLLFLSLSQVILAMLLAHISQHCNTLNYILCTYPIPLHHTATYCNTLCDIKVYFVHIFHPAATHCNTMQNTQT